MEKTGEPQYSEAINRADEAYDKLREVLRQQGGLGKKLKIAIQTRLHTQNPKRLAELSSEIGRLSEQILFFDAEKGKLVAEMGGWTDKHKRGRELMDRTKTKYIN